MKTQRALFADSLNVNKKEHTVSAVAAAVGISQPYMSDILNGRRQPSIRVAKKIAAYFEMPQVKLYILMGWVDDGLQDTLLKFLDEVSRNRMQV